MEQEHHEEHPKLAALAAALAIGAILGAMIGFGGKGFGGGEPGGSKGPCQLRLDAAGLWRNGQLLQTSPLARPAIDIALSPCSEATVLVTGDARSGDRDDLIAALEAAGIPYSCQPPARCSVGP